MADTFFARMDKLLARLPRRMPEGFQPTRLVEADGMLHAEYDVNGVTLFLGAPVALRADLYWSLWMSGEIERLQAAGYAQF